MYYAYIRVSTDTQTVENQKLVITEWAKQRGITIDEWISDVKSGTLLPKKRKLGKLIAEVKSGDIIVCTELSRLGRSMTMIFNILEELQSREIGVIAVKEGYELTNTLVAKVLAFAFSISAEIERQMISERTKAGLLRARAAGKRIGRMPGQKPTKYKLSSYKDNIAIQLQSGKSIYALAKIYGVRWATMKSFIERENLMCA